MSPVKKQTSNAGFTLVETLAVIAITALIFVAVSWAITSFYRANSYIIQQSLSINSARKGVEKMVREIREAAYSDTGAYPIVSASSTEFVFYSDINRNNNVEKVRYSLKGSNFERGVIEASGDPPVYNPADETAKVLSAYVRNSESQPVFTYFDSSGNQIADLSNVSGITLVKVRLVVNVAESRTPDEFTLRSTAQIRNLKTNL